MKALCKTLRSLCYYGDPRLRDALYAAANTIERQRLESAQLQEAMRVLLIETCEHATGRCAKLKNACKKARELLTARRRT